MEIAIDLKASTDHARRIITDIVAAHPAFIDRRKPQDMDIKPVVDVRVVRLTDRAVVLRTALWANSPDAVTRLQSDALEAIKKRFDAEGIAWPQPA